MTAEYAGTAWKPCYYFSFCGCESRWERYYEEITHWDFDICTERTDYLVFEEAEYSGSSDIWK
jgi:hypothetical protein